ncbi:hypothetical protein [Aquabacterium sp.]|uniref:hypothetical protein n=1 Tax=Aquabacterium sp. TaxID=1872578 RepID=UPI003BAE83AE
MDADRAREAAALWQPPDTSGPASAMVGLSRYCRLVGQRFLEMVEQAVASEAPMSYSPQRWRHTLIKQAGRLPEPVLCLATDWLWGRVPALAGEWRAVGTGTRLVNAAYVALAEWVGPVKADACFTRIVREFESSGDAHLKPVRRYL